jgi:hypothetical protein
LAPLGFASASRGLMPGMPGFHMWKTQRSEYLLGG